MSQSNSDAEEMYETLNTRGWDLLLKEFGDIYDTCNRVEGCSTVDELHYRRGMMAVLQQLFNLKEDITERINADL